MLVGEAFGLRESERGVPFVGASGQELDRMLLEAGIHRSACYVTNLVNEQPPGNDFSSWVVMKKKDRTQNHVLFRDKYVLPIVIEGFKSLLFEINHVKPNIIVPLGNWPMWALSGHWGITKWRGSLLQDERGSKLLPTIHPAAVLRQWELRMIVVQDLRRVAFYQNDRKIIHPDWHFTIRPSLDTVLATFQSLWNALDKGIIKWLDFDLETRAGHIACAGLSWSLLDAICIPFMTTHSHEGYWSFEEESLIVWWLWRLLTHPRASIRGQNLLYDAQYTYRWWHFVPRVEQDTMISFHVAWAGLPKRLDFQSSMYCDNYVYWKDDGKKWGKSVGEEQLWVYNCTDCVRTREVGEGLIETVKSLNLEAQHKFHQRLFWPTLYAMKRGIKIDLKAKSALSLELQEEIGKRERFLEDILGHPINIASSSQMINLFYGDFGMTPIMSAPKRMGPAHITCDDEALELLKIREPVLKPIIRTVQELRSLNVFFSTFVNARLDIDDRMRCSFNICGTETYRFSSSKNAFESGLNLQNIPMGGEENDSDLKLPNVRKLFVPDPGFTAFDLDLSKADLRVVVWESDEREMKAMLAEGRDPYVETAREFYRDPSITKNLPSGLPHPKYATFKSFSHGLHYLGTPRGLARKLNLTVHEAERTQAWYFGKYPRIPEWQKRFKAEVASKHYVSNVFGYRRYYFDRIGDEVFRKAIAWLPQSTVGILIDHIWLNIFDNIPQAEVLIQVHDSLFGQFPTYLTDRMKSAILAQAHVTVPYPDPLIIPSVIKTSDRSWGDCIG